MIEVAALGFDYEAPGRATMGTIGSAAGVNGIHQFYPFEIEAQGSADIHRTDVSDTLRFKPAGDFEIGDTLGAGARRNPDTVADVILVSVGQNYVIGGDSFDVDLLCQRIVGDPRVDEKIARNQLAGPSTSTPRQECP
jgi:hypothetical protein